MTCNTPVFCAVDKPNIEAAIKLCDVVQETGIGIKLGLEFFNALGPQGVKEIQTRFPGIPVFMDMKYYDIPNTVAGAVRAVSENLKPAYLNVHASGGLEMMQAAKEACAPETKLIAVTILTSFDEQGMRGAGYKDNIRERVVEMAKLTQKAGLDGIVCSSHEIDVIRKECGKDFVLMVPGIRPAGSNTDDQKRVLTPKEAIDKGATHLVIGRPISQADNPLKAVQDILTSLEA